MAVATLALVGFFVALYLSLWKLGYMGVMACGEGGACEAVQSSEFAYLFGLPVAFYGVGGYLSLLVVSLVGLQPRYLADRRVTIVLVALSGLGVGFTMYLSYLEAFVIEAWCRWCLVSAALIGSIFLAALAGFIERPAMSTTS